MRITFQEIVKSSHGDESMMWDSVARVNAFVEKMKEVNPAAVDKFLQDEYVAMNGKHINEWLARKIVSDMWHENGDKVRVDGEAVTVEDSMTLLDGMDADKQEKLKWDAYVGANGFMHDLANTGLSKGDILNAARHFWFHDDDMGDCSKVFWYYVIK